MENISDQTTANKWLSVPIIATITRLLCRELTLHNEYLRQENKLLKSKIKKRIIFTDDERRTLVEAPNANAHAERYVLNCKRECLNHLLIFGLNRLQNILDCYTLYFNEHRPHQGIGNRIPGEYNINCKRQGGNMPLDVSARNVVRKDFLGGLLKSYRRAA